MFIAGWTMLSLALLWFLGIFRGRKLAEAPARSGSLTLLHLFAAVGLYIGSIVIAGAVLGIIYPEPNDAATQQAAMAGAPGTMAATGTQPATGLANATTESDGMGELREMVKNGKEVAAREEAKHIGENVASWICSLGVASAVLLMARQRMAEGLAGFGMNLGKVPGGAAKGLLAAVVVFPLVNVVALAANWVAGLLRLGPEMVHPVLDSAKTGDWNLRWALIITAVVAAPLVEELLFRGLLQTILLRLFRAMMNGAAKEDVAQAPGAEQWYAAPVAERRVGIEALGRWLVILTSSAIFTLVHYSVTDWQGMTALFVLALGLGYVYERTGNLWACITLHMLFNGVNFALFLSGT